MPRSFRKLWAVQRLPCHRARWPPCHGAWDTRLAVEKDLIELIVRTDCHHPYPCFFAVIGTLVAIISTLIAVIGTLIAIIRTLIAVIGTLIATTPNP